MLGFIAGMIVMGFCVAALLFTRYWRRTGDPFFLVFAAFFCLSAASQLLVVFSGSGSEQGTWIFVVRFAAFALLLVAILKKNFSAKSSDSRR